MVMKATLECTCSVYQEASFVNIVYDAAGTWFGIELDRPAGKNDGSVAGVQYFTCRPKHGVFAPLSRIQK